MKIEQLGEFIRFHRKKAGLSRIKLAEFAELGKTAIYDIEHGKLTVNLLTLLKILKVLNIQMHFDSPLIDKWENRSEPKS
jgi:HTH-type transcriptional regulator/antitoxin HipB